MIVKVLSTVALPLIIFIIIRYFDTLEYLKIIPSLFSSLFFYLFLDGYLRKKHLILRYTQRFYKKDLSSEKKKFLASSDIYWAGVLFLNILIQVFFMLQENDAIWAFYSSVGWYIYLIVALVLHMLYEKFFVSSKLDV